MSKVKTEMFPVFSRQYKKAALYIIFVVTISLGASTAFMEFLHDRFFWGIFYLLIAIYWNLAIFLPFIRSTTLNKPINKNNIDKQNIVLNKNYARIEQIISLLIIIAGISLFVLALTSGHYGDYTYGSLWFALIGFCHFSFVLVTRIDSKPKYH